MKTELILANSLKQLMSKESLDDITVKKLVEECGIKRQTFYYHFRDIYDLLTWIFLNEQLEKNIKINSWENMVIAIDSYVRKNQKFIQNTLASAGKDLFLQFVFSHMYSILLKQISEKNDVNADYKRLYVSYFAAGITNAIVVWIAKDKNENVLKLIKELQYLIGKDVF